MAEVYRAPAGFTYTDTDGVSTSVAGGALMSDDHPDFKGLSHMFVPAESGPVEVVAAEPAPETDVAAEPAPKTVKRRPEKADG